MSEATDGLPATGPLRGLRVIELGSTVAAPYCARLLADFGADVIKVEQAEGDAVRSMGRREDGRSLYAASILRGKRLASIDLRSEAGRGLVRRLLDSADILVENFRAGTLERWGLGYEALSARNPGLVMVRISGFGQDGPASGRAGYGVVCEAMSGLRDLTGEPDAPPPRMNTSLTDYIAGLYAAFGAMMALQERARTGRGQVVDSALYEGAFTFMEPHVPAFDRLGAVAARAGSRLPGNTPNSLYGTRDGRHIVIAAAADAVWRRMADAMGRPELGADPRFATAAARARNADACEELVAGWAAAQDLDAVAETLEANKVPAAPIYNVADIFADPHYRAREMLVEAPDPEWGSVTVTGVVPKLSATPGRIRWAGRETGADTASVLRDELGLEDRDIDRLAGDGVVAGKGLPRDRPEEG